MALEALEEARKLEREGEIGRAILRLEQAVAEGEESAALYKELARMCLAINEIRAFSNYTHEAVRLDPLDPEPHLMLARVLIASRRWAEAMETIEAALAIPGLAEGDREAALSLLGDARAKT